MKKNKNPLYVVTNDGKDVLEASGLFDAMLKKLGLEPMLEQLDMLLKMVLGMVSSYAVFSVVKEWLDQFVAAMEGLIKKIDPVLAFSLFN
ncbi:MAG: hypothetical protein COW01_14865 [Bdellovibrionales bacterium CG12_big_fil_rev_8_21_14_0_65_38_15]|nr:MAG: hypothetical protein COW79_15385 [Bdellovibrionales bacterium CG22_combo_CG10-13_8_21_14_all_38_13]PIQ52827.1 MAG: hypothetical protein COW01_14865 [Bdellovibrionales bacterium CG12_big_fil_rev_8_21_14_0_65_38_15]